MIDHDDGSGPEPGGNGPLKDGPPVTETKSPEVQDKSEKQDGHESRQTHAPVPDRGPRPDEGMGAAVNRWAHNERQAQLAYEAEPALTEEQRSQEKIAQMREAFSKAKDRAFNEDRVGQPDKGELSRHHADTVGKGGIDR